MPLDYDPAQATAADKEKAEAERVAKEAEEATVKAKAEEDAEKQRLAEERAGEKAAFDSRMGQLESILHSRFAAKQDPAPAATPTPGPGVTADDFLTPDGAKAAAEKLAEEKAVQVGVALDKTYRAEINELREVNFDTKLAVIKADPYYKYVANEMELAIEKTPALRTQPKALDILYNSLIGTKRQSIVSGEIDAAKGVENDEAEMQRREAARPEFGTRRSTPAAPSGPVDDTRPGPSLSADEQEMRSKFAAVGVNITPERWAESRDSRRAAPSEPIPDLERGN